MTESLRSQLATAETMLRDSETRLNAFHGLRDELRSIVGHAEFDEGKIVAEWSATDGLTTLELDPRTMRMPSMDLAEAIRTTIRDAVADLGARTQQVIRERGALPTDATSPEQLQQRLAQVREQFVSTGRAAADGLDRAQERLDRVERR